LLLPPIVDRFYAGFEGLLRDSTLDVLDIGKVVPFPSFHARDIINLCDCALLHFRSQPVILRLDCPVCIVGDIHGNVHDLLRIFREQGLGKNYLFLGDYIDRGQFSLECIVLLFTLALAYPGQFHLVRGNHETVEIASVYGFQAELQGMSYPHSVLDAFCRAFSWMPIAAIVQNRYFCVHGGIGPHVGTIEELEGMDRPFVMGACPQAVSELLWADPTDTVQYFRRSPTRGISIEYGPVAVQEFLQKNGLETIIRAHACVDGVSKLPGMPVFTVFSAGNYHDGNHSGTIVITRDGDPITFRYLPFELMRRADALFYTMGMPENRSLTMQPVRRGMRQPRMSLFSSLSRVPVRLTFPRSS
jgi:hypothetical protein